MQTNNVIKKNAVRRIIDAQQGRHKNLEKVVLKHFNSDFKKPIADHTQSAFNQIKPQVEAALHKGTPLIFDSGCGTAMSTHIIASKYPNALVVGIDRSVVRLSKSANETLPDNVILIQADCVDFWLLANQAGWKLEKHTILYPNPYPKSKHLKRRWHAHPVFPTLVALSEQGEIMLRTNWDVYADEFFYTFDTVLEDKGVRCSMEVIQPDTPLTLFEKKYCENSQELYQVRISL